MTDEQGRYRLSGVPKGREYELTVYPPVSRGYLGTLVRAADTEGLKPLTADVELRRGAEVRCRFVDKETRRPVRGVVHYTPIATNPHYREAEVAAGYVPTREFDRVHVPDADGVFRLVAYPGPGLLVFNGQGNDARYARARIDPADEKAAAGDRHLESAGIFPGYRLIEPAAGATLTLDIELTPTVPAPK